MLLFKCFYRYIEFRVYYLRAGLVLLYITLLRISTLKRDTILEISGVLLHFAIFRSGVLKHSFSSY